MVCAQQNLSYCAQIKGVQPFKDEAQTALFQDPVRASL
jgi:hypothetical protein